MYAIRSYYEEIVYLADQEATAAERYLCKHARNQRQTGTSDDCADVRYCPQYYIE